MATGDDRAGGRGRRAAAAVGHLLRLALLAWLAFVGFLLVAVVGIVASGGGDVDPDGSTALISVTALFAGTLAAWAGVRRVRDRPLRPGRRAGDVDAAPDTAPRDLFAREGSLHPVVLAVLLVR